MSPARPTREDLLGPGLASGGLWAAKAQGPDQQEEASPPQQQKAARGGPLDPADDIKTLWETSWKPACKRRQHPFQDAHYLDFAPTFAALVQQGVTSARWPAYTRTFTSLAQGLADDAEAHASSSSSPRHPGGAQRAARLLLRACALLRVARYPYPPSGGWPPGTGDACDLKRRAYELQKTYYRRAVDLRSHGGPLDEVLVPHIHDPGTDPDPGRGGGRGFDMGMRAPERRLKRPHIPLCVRVPPRTLCTGAPCPAAILLTRDRTGETRACEDVLARGWAAVVVEVPGAGECPIPRREGEDEDEDEEEQDRRAAEEVGLWASVLDWMRAVAFYDMERVVAVGAGDVAVRMAETCGARLRGVVAYLDQGPGDDGPVFGDAPSCQALVVVGAGGSGSVESNGLWTPVRESRERDGEGLMALSAYSPGTRAPVGRLATSDEGSVYDWMEDVMESRDAQIPGPVSVPRSLRPADKSCVRPMPEWFSRECTPPLSDVEMTSVCGSSL